MSGREMPDGDDFAPESPPVASERVSDERLAEMIVSGQGNVPYPAHDAWLDLRDCRAERDAIKNGIIERTVERDNAEQYVQQLKAERDRLRALLVRALSDIAELMEDYCTTVDSEWGWPGDDWVGVAEWKKAKYLLADIEAALKTEAGPSREWLSKMADLEAKYPSVAAGAAANYGRAAATPAPDLQREEVMPNDRSREGLRMSVLPAAERLSETADAAPGADVSGNNAGDR